MSRKDLTDEELLGKVSEHGFKSIEEYCAWSRSWEPSYRYYSEDFTLRDIGIQEDGFAYSYASCLYTDGDGGVMLFRTTNDVFEADGMSIQLLNCSWCDISYAIIEEINEEMEFLKENYSRRLSA